MNKIQIKPSKVGSLHRHLNIPEGEKIPVSKLKIKDSDSPAIKKKKQFALNARKWNHELGGYVLPDEDNMENPIKQLMKNGGKPILEKKSKKLTEENKHLNWVQRGVNPEKYPYLLDEEGNKMTHMLSYGKDDKSYYVYPNIIQNEQGQLQDLDPDEAHGWALESNTIMRVPNRRIADYYSKNGLIKHYAGGGEVPNPYLVPPKPLNQIEFDMERPLPPGVSYERDVEKFNWNKRNVPVDKQIPLDSTYRLYKPPKGYSNVYDKKGQQIGYTIDNKVLIPGEPNFEDGGMIKAWIQKFSNGGYIADGGFPAGQELTQPTTNYNQFMTMDQLNQKPFENPYQNMNLQQSSSPQFNIPQGQEMQPLQSIGMQKLSPNMQNTQNSINRSMKDMSPDQKSPVNMNPVNMGLDIGTQSMGAAANLMSSFGKDNSKSKAFGQGANNAMNVAGQVTAPFKDIPIAGKAIDAVGKTLGFFIGGALNARRQGIENEEMDKYNKLQEYTSRNAPAALAPSFYGQTMAKYGSNPKMMEQRIIDDIYTDFDKYMKLT